jgi:hypothetical protein
MRFATIAVLCFLVGLTGASPLWAQRGPRTIPDPAKGYSWKEEARKRLAAEDVEALQKNKLLMPNEAFKQIFTPYVSSDLPLFITADSLLNGYHVLFEESVLRMERANARKLPEILRFVWANLGTVDAKLEGKPELVAASKFRAQAVMGVALKLLGNDTVKIDGKLAAAIAEEVKRVVAAEGRGKPEWLGPADKGFLALDYTRFRPRGFYTKSQDLERYFRAVSWLQAIPFRVEKDEELLAILMLGNCISHFRFQDDLQRGEEYHGFFRRLDHFVGPADDWDILTAAHHAQLELRLRLDEGALARKRQQLLKAARGEDRGPQINDQLRFIPEEPDQVAEVSFRILSVRRTPDAVLFQRTTDQRKFRRPYPSGLEVAAALGSPFARSFLSLRESEDLLATITANKGLFAGEDLYRQYLACLEALFAAPEPDAPAFIGTEPWKIKSCQTALAGWAQLRHTWALQAKQTIHYMGLTNKPPGFVEPNPEFFARMARLVERTDGFLRQAGIATSDPGQVVEDLRAVVKLLKEKDVVRKGAKVLEKLTLDEIAILARLEPLAELLGLGTEGDSERSARTLMEKAEKLASRIEKGELKDDPRLARVMRESDENIEPLWRRLERLCRRLEAVAHKQLRRVAFSDDENAFLLRYGEELAGIMLYGGNSYLTPRDDAPRVVDVFTNPTEGRVLEVGVARARALYVLYPLPGGEVLCRGAVLPYYEFPHTSRLTDAEWKKLLDSKDRPEVPTWVRPIVWRDGIKAPKLKGD